MKKIFLSTAIFLLVSFQMQSQWFGGIKGNGEMQTITRNIEDFDHLAVSGSFTVTLVYGLEHDIKIKIEENLIEYLITEVNGDKLSIRWKKGVSISTRKGVFIVVPFKNLNQVSLYGSGDILCDDSIKSEDFNTLLTGSGDIILNIDVDKITAKVTGSGDLELLGKAKEYNVLVTGSGDVQSYNLVAKNVDAKISGSGDIKLTVTDNFNARIIGSGDITYKGNPENENFKIIGSGDIESK